MQHNRSLKNINKRPINIYANTKWNAPEVRSDLFNSLHRQEIMKFDPNANWNKEQIKPMHWDPRASWNPNTAGDVVHKRETDRLLSRFAFRGPQPANFAYGFYDRPTDDANRKCFKCGVIGHIGRNCPNAQNKGGKSRKHKKISGRSRTSHKGRNSRKN